MYIYGKDIQLNKNMPLKDIYLKYKEITPQYLKVEPNFNLVEPILFNNLKISLIIIY